MEILNNGRIGLGTGSVGATKGLLDRIIDHVKERRQFGGPLADLELVQDKIGWMVSYLFGLESMAYLTCGLVDRGVSDYSLESAVCKVSGTEFLWYAANRVLQLKGGEGYLRDQPYERVLRDIRIFPIFEGANDVLRSFIALSGMKPLGEQLSGLADLDLGDPIGSLGVLIDYVGGRIQREVRPDTVTLAHPEPPSEPTRSRIRSSGSVTSASRSCAVTGRTSSDGVPAQAHRRRSRRHLRQVAVLSRVSSIFETRASSRRARSATSPRRSAPGAADRVAPGSTRSSTTTTRGCRRSRSWRTSAASTATRCSRTSDRSFGLPLGARPQRVASAPRPRASGCRAASAGPPPRASSTPRAARQPAC